MILRSKFTVTQKYFFLCFETAHMMTGTASANRIINHCSVLWCCWLGSKKGIWPVKTEWWDASMVSCHMARDDLIYDFTAVTFSMKVAFFREKMLFSVKSVFFFWILTLLLSFIKVSAFNQQHLCIFCSLLNRCHTWALNSWHVFNVLLTVTLDCLESWLSIYICSKYSLCRNFKCTIRQIS